MLGSRLRKFRKEEGLKQADVAFHLGVSRQQVSRYERGQSDMNTYMLMRFCALVRISPNDLLEDVCTRKK